MCAFGRASKASGFLSARFPVAERLHAPGPCTRRTSTERPSGLYRIVPTVLAGYGDAIT